MGCRAPSIPLVPSPLLASKWCMTQPSSDKAQRPAFILLLHCEGLLAPPSKSSNLHTEGWRGLSISALRDTGNQGAFVGYLSSVATTTNSRWLSPLCFWSQVEVLASHLALKQVHCKHTFWWLWFPYFLFSILPIHLSNYTAYLHSINTGASAKNRAWMYSCTNLIRALTNTPDDYINPFPSHYKCKNPHMDKSTLEYLSF